MFLFTQLASQLISLAAIGVYLAAAFLPCEPTAEEHSALATALSGGTVHSAVSPPKPPRLQKDAVDEHAHHSEAGQAAPSSAHDHTTHDHSAHAHSDDTLVARDESPAVDFPPAAGAGPAACAAAPRSVEVTQAHLSLKAKCVCDCDRTRAQAGGGAARLGSVVLAAVVTSLAPAARGRCMRS